MTNGKGGGPGFWVITLAVTLGVVLAVSIVSFVRHEHQVQQDQNDIRDQRTECNLAYIEQRPPPAGC